MNDGFYCAQAGTAQGIKEVMRDAPHWNRLPHDMKESLDQISSKISRILHGDPLDKKHWESIVNHATLIVRDL